MKLHEIKFETVLNNGVVEQKAFYKHPETGGWMQISLDTAMVVLKEQYSFLFAEVSK